MSATRPPRTVDELREAMRSAKLSGRAMVAKYDGECGWCGQAIIAGDVSAYLPDDKAMLCAGCATDGDGKP